MNQALAWEHTYNSKLAFNGVPPTPSMEFLAFMAEGYWDKKGLQFLDLGSGPGGSTLFLAERGFRITAVEFSKSACDRLRYFLGEKNQLLVDIINSDAMEVDFPEAKFDCILTIGFFEHLSLEQSCIIGKRLKKWLKPGGNILAKVLAQPLQEEVKHPGVDINIYSGTEVVDMIFSEFDGQLRIDTRYVSEKLIQITNWTFYARHKNED